MPDKLSLYNGALRIIKQTRLATLSDDRPERYDLDDEYPKTLAYMLNEGLWNFALRTVSLEPSTDIEPGFGPSYLFEQPSDFVRLNAISGTEFFTPTLDDYIDEGTYWLAEVNPLYVSFVSDATTHGGDLSRWTAAFERAFEYELAVRVGPNIAALSTSEFDELKKEARFQLRNARSKDALAQPAQKPPTGRLVRARRSWLNSYRNGRY